ncbi:MAG: type II toxin-antitoxin system HicB family antitoxin [Alphaproteobacteria bacterium]
MRFIYPITLTEMAEGPPAEHGFAVTFPGLPEANTWGDTRAEALANAADCLEKALAARIANREDLPAPSPARGRPTAAPGSLIGSKAALYLALRQADVRPSDLARRMGVQPSVVTRLLNPRHASRPGQFDAAFAALDQRLVVSLEPVA